MLDFICPDSAVMSDSCNRFVALIQETINGIEAPSSDDFDTIEEMLEDWRLLLQAETLVRAQKATDLYRLKQALLKTAKSTEDTQAWANRIAQADSFETLNGLQHSMEKHEKALARKSDAKDNDDVQAKKPYRAPAGAPAPLTLQFQQHAAPGEPTTKRFEQERLAALQTPILNALM